MIGFVPYTLGHLYTGWEFQNYHKEDGLFVMKHRKQSKLGKHIYKKLFPAIENSTMIFWLIILKQMVVGLGQTMALNAANIVMVRMQNVDYRHNRSLLRAIADLFIVDKHRMFYRGLVPISIACANL
jgi:hypothetical protein